MNSPEGEPGVPDDDEAAQDLPEQAGDQFDGAFDEASNEAFTQAFEAGSPPSPPYRRGRGGRQRRWRAVLYVLASLVTIVVVVAAVAYVRIRDDVSPPGPMGRAVTVDVPKGASTVHIGQLLARAGVLHGADFFAFYVKLKGAGPLLAGIYELRRNESYSRVVRELEAGPSETSVKLVVPEGYTVAQIATAVARLHDGISHAAFVAAATSGTVRSAYEPAGTHNLEGFLFPATYPIPPGETATGLVAWMVRTFDDHAAGLGLAEGAQHLRYTPYQVLIVASIVEREAKWPQDRGPIASVIYNRLARGTPIGAESTLLYGLGGPSGPVSPTTPSPYNTLVNKGLPPTPIANPGLPSLRAAIAPPQTNYMYWVEINRGGQMGFASDDAQFKQLVHECHLAQLC